MKANAVLLRTLGLLFLLTALSVFIARVNPTSFKALTALTFAVAKALLVLYYFMHIHKGGKAVAVTFMVTLAILALFIGLTFFDVAYR